MGAGKRKNEKAVGRGIKKRKCLRCGKKFTSFSPQNRLCLDCKKSPEFTNGLFTERDDGAN